MGSHQSHTAHLRSLFVVLGVGAAATLILALCANASQRLRELPVHSVMF